MVTSPQHILKQFRLQMLARKNCLKKCFFCCKDRFCIKGVGLGISQEVNMVKQQHRSWCVWRLNTINVAHYTFIWINSTCWIGCKWNDLRTHDSVNVINCKQCFLSFGLTNMYSSLRDSRC